MRISRLKKILNGIMLTERSNGLPPKHLHNDGVNVRKFLSVGKVRQPASPYHLVNFRLCFSLYRGIVQHCIKEYGDGALGLTRKVEREEEYDNRR